MTVRGVEDQQVAALREQRVDAFFAIDADADGRADPQPPELVLGRVGMLLRLLDVLDRDQALHRPRRVDDDQLLDAVLVQKLLGLFQRGRLRSRHQAGRHHRGDALLEVALEAHVAVGEDADGLAVMHDRQPRDVVLAHQLERARELLLGADRDRVDDHAALGLLDLQDLERLLLGRQVAVDDAQAALARHADRGRGFRHRVHRRRHERCGEHDRIGEPRAYVGVLRQHFAVGGNQHDVVESERFAERLVDHRDA